MSLTLKYINTGSKAHTYTHKHTLINKKGEKNHPFFNFLSTLFPFPLSLPFPFSSHRSSSYFSPPSFLLSFPVSLLSRPSPRKRSRPEIKRRYLSGAPEYLAPTASLLPAFPDSADGDEHKRFANPSEGHRVESGIFFCAFHSFFF